MGIRDETNDYERTGQIGDKQPKTRAERRKKRREDRERRRRERAKKRKENRKKNRERDGSQGVFSIILWSVLGFFYTLIRPWTWHIALLVPLVLSCCGCAGYGLYLVYDEMNIGNRRRGRRAPRYDSWSYKIANMFSRKTMKQRV